MSPKLLRAVSNPSPEPHMGNTCAYLTIKSAKVDKPRAGEIPGIAMVNAQDRVQREGGDHGGKELEGDTARSHCQMPPAPFPPHMPCALSQTTPKALGQGLVPMVWWGQQVTFPVAALWAAYADQGLTSPFASLLPRGTAQGSSLERSKMELSQAQIQPQRSRAQEGSWDAAPWDGLPRGPHWSRGVRSLGLQGTQKRQCLTPETAALHCFPALTILHVRNWFQKEAPSSKLNRTPPANTRHNIFTKGMCHSPLATAPAEIHPRPCAHTAQTLSQASPPSHQ